MEQLLCNSVFWKEKDAEICTRCPASPKQEYVYQIHFNTTQMIRKPPRICRGLSNRKCVSNQEQPQQSRHSFWSAARSTKKYNLVRWCSWISWGKHPLFQENCVGKSSLKKSFCMEEEKKKQPHVITTAEQIHHMTQNVSASHQKAQLS